MRTFTRRWGLFRVLWAKFSHPWQNDASNWWTRVYTRLMCFMAYHLKPLYTQAMRTVKPLYIQAMFLLIRQILINWSTKTNQLSDHGWPPDSQITKFANYMVETFVGDDAMSPPPPLLKASLPDDDGDDIPRTTNGAEAFHSNFNRQFKSARPNMYALAISTQTDAAAGTKISSHCKLFRNEQKSNWNSAVD